MATTNPVTQVLVPTGNQSPLAAGSRETALAVGQIGVFNAHTGLSVGVGSPVGDLQDIYLAVGIDPNGTGSIQDVNRSAGQVIQKRNMKSYTLRGYMDELPQIVEFTGFKAKCEKGYALKVEFRNQKIYKVAGYNQFAKTYNFFTGCCADECADCGDGSCTELAVGLVANINVDPDKLITASLFASDMVATVNTAPTADGSPIIAVGTESFTVPILDADTVNQVAAKIAAAINAVPTSAYYATATVATIKVHPKKSSSGNAALIALTSAGGTGITLNAIGTTDVVVTDVPAFVAANPGVCLGIRITGNTQAINTYCSVNLKYDNPRGTFLIISPIEGFECNGVVTTTQKLQYSEGKGYDIRDMEYMAGGFNGKPGPYRVSETTGLAREGFQYFASTSVNYQMLDLTYDQFSVGGWLEYLNNLETLVAIPCTDTTTLTDLIALLDVIFTQFAPMAGDAALLDCTNAKTSTLTPATDGIESLS